jgi:hypothetical protein
VTTRESLGLVHVYLVSPTSVELRVSKREITIRQSSYNGGGEAAARRGAGIKGLLIVEMKIS